MSPGRSITATWWARAVLAGAVVLVVGGGAAAGACKFALDCGLRGGGPLELEDVAVPSSAETELPEGFREEAVTTGLRFPTSFDFLPGGRMLVAEREGVLRVADGGRLSTTPVLDLSERVDTTFFRGLVAVAVDPLFETNGFVYVLYTLHSPTDEPTGPTSVRLSRFTISGDRAEPGSEKILLGSVEPPSGSCTDLPATADCLPSDLDHIGGDIAFAADGSVFVSTGDGGGKEEVEETAFRAMDVDALGGKILHITRDGAGIASNPFYDGDVSANRAKVWAVGLRNPFRLTLSPGTELPVVGEVGWMSFDEITTAPRGANLGWPCFEARTKTQQYRQTARCRTFYEKASRNVTFPALAFPHDASASITGGVFNTADAFPERFRGAYFFGDWAYGLIRTVPADPATGTLGAVASRFASKAGGPVQFRLGPDGLLYYLALNDGELRRIRPASS